MPTPARRLLAAVAVCALVATVGAVTPAPRVGAETVAPAKPARPAVRVAVAEAAKQAMPVVLDLVGNAQAVVSIPVKSRIDSQIERVGVAEGERVAAGQVIFTLDGRAIRAQVAQQRAVVARDEAQLALILSDLERTEQLVRTRTKSARDLESAKTQVAAQEATIAAARALLDNLEVQASYTVIASPIAGRVGSIPLKAGASVRAADSALLATINQLDPIHVAFAVPQPAVASLRRALAAGEVAVEIRRPADAAPVAVGRVAFIENTLDAATGTLGVKAVVPNAGETLLPGEYLRIRVRLSTEAEALVVPESALQLGQNGTYVWCVAADGAAVVRPVVIDRTVDGVSVVAKGLTVGDRVVTEGQLRLAPGVPLDIARPAAPKSGS